MAPRASWLACALVLVACAEDGTESATTAVTEPSSPTAPAETLEPLPSVPTPTARAEEAAEPRTIDAPVPEGAAAGLAEAGEALSEAIRAGAAVEGATPCETAYAGAIAMIEALQTRTGQAGQGGPPDRAAYLEGCGALPEAAQRCLGIRYALEHAEECQTWRSDPRVLALRDQLAR